MTVINRVVFQQGDGKGHGEGRWWWHAIDTRNQRSYSSQGARPNGWRSLRRAVDNAEGLLGEEVNLIMVRGEYTHGQVLGRDITVRVVR